MRSLFSALLLALSLAAAAQPQNVQGSLQSKEAQLSILRLFPDSFPSVNIVFRARRADGSPFWNLSTDQLSVAENGVPATITRLTRLSEQEPVSIGIVLDHSGSMGLNIASTRFEHGVYISTLNNDAPPPIEHARKAVRRFIESFPTEKASIALTAFSDTVDIRTALGSARPQLLSRLEKVEADGGTALYDGIDAGLTELLRGEGIRVLVVLTDGLDNGSKVIPDSVLAKARRAEIPIYTIGLGEADKKVLQEIALQTRGQAFFTEKPESLDSVYASISRNIHAFYSLTYHSPSLSARDSSRDVTLRFDTDSGALSDARSMALPPAVRTVLLEAEREERNTKILWGGLAVVLLAGSSTILLRYRKGPALPPAPPVLQRVYPNPTQGVLHAELDAAPGTLQVVSGNGTVLRSYRFQQKQVVLQLAGLPAGTYYLYIETKAGRSAGTPVVLQ